MLLLWETAAETCQKFLTFKKFPPCSKDSNLFISVLSSLRYVGEAEKRIRELFADAEAEQKSAGASSDLHIIIFDEIDAICKTRGTTRDGTGVGDSIVSSFYE